MVLDMIYLSPFPWLHFLPHSLILSLLISRQAVIVGKEAALER